MSRNIVFEGWLTKSPPAKRIWRAKWRKRWFSLRQSGELPGQYLLDYYTDRNCRRLKGTINLDLCEQVDAGLHMERGNGSLDPKLRGSVFTVRTQSRTYHLEAESEADMEKWVDAICRVCGLRATEDSSDVIGKYQNSIGAVAAMNAQYDCADRTGPYIPISECITGVRAQNSQRAFTFDPQNIVTSTRVFERASDPRALQMYTSQPHIRFNAEFSENESNLSDEDCKSLTASQSHIEEWSVAKSFTKLAVSPKQNGSENGPPEPPPRPPKTFCMKDSVLKEAFQGPKFKEPTCDSISLHPEPPRLRRLSQCHSPTSPGRLAPASHRCTDDEEDMSPGHPSLQYFNMSSLPPAVDRALKPRHSSHSISYIHNLIGNQNSDHHGSSHHEDEKADVLQYLDLDLHSSKPVVTKQQSEEPKKKLEIVHDKSPSAVDTDSEYKTVDFLKTEAFNITRQDAEASRNTQH